MALENAILNDGWLLGRARGLLLQMGVSKVGSSWMVLFLVLGFNSTDIGAAETEGGAWLVAATSDSFGSGENPGNWRWSLQGQLRKFTLGDGLRQGVIRGGLGYKVSSNVTLWGGYAYYHTKLQNFGTAREHRIWQQVSWTVGRWGWGTLKSRTRLEQRFRENRDGTGWWVRQLFGVEIPIGGRDNLDFILAAEGYFHLKETGWSDDGFVQNRVYVMLGYKPSRKLRIEAGYLNQYFRVRGSPNLMNHVAVVSFRFL